MDSGSVCHSNQGAILEVQIVKKGAMSKKRDYDVRLPAVLPLEDSKLPVSSTRSGRHTLCLKLTNTSGDIHFFIQNHLFWWDLAQTDYIFAFGVECLLFTCIYCADNIVFPFQHRSRFSLQVPMCLFRVKVCVQSSFTTKM